MKRAPQTSGYGARPFIRLLALFLVAGCAPRAAVHVPAPRACAPVLPAAPVTDGLIAVSSAGDGSVTLVYASNLAIARVIDSPELPAYRREPPMAIATDPRRGVFWVANFGGGVGRIPASPAAGSVAVAQTAGPLSGIALSPDGCVLAANGVRDLALRLIDPSDLRVATVSFGDAIDPPKHLLTQGLASTHPVWLGDSSALLTEDNLHEQIVLVSRDGKILARRAARSAVHSILLAKTGEALALEEGTADLAPRVLVLAIPSLEIVRAIDVALPAGEPAKLHHGALSPDGDELVVANMGSLKGDSGGTTVAAFAWRTGELLWSASTVRNASHVAFAKDRLFVIGHRAAEIIVLDAKTGTQLESWPVLGAGSPGHSLLVDADGSVTILDAPLGRLLRFRAGEPAGESERVGAGDAESSLPE